MNLARRIDNLVSTLAVDRDGLTLLRVASDVNPASLVISAGTFSRTGQSPRDLLIENIARGTRATAALVDAINGPDGLSPGSKARVMDMAFSEQAINDRLAESVPIEEVFPSIAFLDDPDHTQRIRPVGQMIDGHERPFLVEGRMSRPRDVPRVVSNVTQPLKDSQTQAINRLGEVNVANMPSNYAVLGEAETKAFNRLLNGVQSWHNAHLFARFLGFDWRDPLNFIPAVGRINTSSMANVERYLRFLRDLHPDRHIHLQVEVIGPWRTVDGVPTVPRGVRYRAYLIHPNRMAVRELPLPQSFFDPAEFIWMSEAALINFYKRIGHPMMDWRGQ